MGKVLLVNISRVLTPSAAKRILQGHDMSLTIETGALRILNWFEAEDHHDRVPA
jgi:hypothetical protein